jgi:hypothetical protein
VSIVCPISSSSPIVNISAFMIKEIYKLQKYIL